ncbi:pimeloyl-ACP methyl ester carboxylesterase [Pedobacter cryoconitis]|uniref:alpha/beta hydrolase family protein n=1 Tax=Pedobacter cryoconitis TaxID=188932 RepID=UPI001616903A|nr:alpha/beta fold hydrolase [Pedobacter cryoconitis]MBB6271144.1 pimeloyl-ACP methyl ester carboxylesterase [Pedobacter cryoconitis]
MRTAYLKGNPTHFATAGISILICLILLLAATGNSSAQQAKPFKTIPDTLNWIDQSRNRLVPVAIYKPDATVFNRKAVILNHGYGNNQWGSFKAYSFLADYLASKGYTVVSIQHELSTDELLPSTGKPQETRRPNWERGVQNIIFVINQLKKTRSDLDYKHLNLIGHSNGGDMVMLFAAEYPKLVDKVISLDNRRMPIPRIKKPAIYSLRSSDQPADEGVLPSSEEQQRLGIKIINLKNITHNEMDDYGKDFQKAEMNKLILGFLTN